MDKIVKRELFDSIYRHLQEKEITVLVGPRQVGKTTILIKLKEKILNEKKLSPNQIKFFNLDLIQDLEVFREQKEFIKYIKEEIRLEKFLFIFIDEIQRLESPGLFLKGIYDLNLPVKIVVTGSSSIEIKSKISEPLTGRKRVFQIFPFSFNEYLLAKEPGFLDLVKERHISETNRNRILEHLFEFIIFGGYPRVVLSNDREEKIQILREIYSSYIEKDIVGYMKIKNPLTFSKLIELLASQIGNLLNLKEVSKTMSIYYRTLENYLFALENTFIIKLIRPYYTNKRKELIKMPKIYFIDTGLRNYALRNFSSFKANKDKGVLLENFVFSSLLESFKGEINYWRTKDGAEVDFILKDFYGNIIPLEVKASELKNLELERSLRNFLEKYSAEKSYVVNLSLIESEKIGENPVNFILPYFVLNL